MLTAEDAAFKVFSNVVSGEVPEPLQTSSRIEVRARHPELRPYDDSGGMESREAGCSDSLWVWYFLVQKKVE